MIGLFMLTGAMENSMLQNALRLRRAGKLAEAAQIYSDILRSEPKHFEALHALGIVRYQCGQLDEAERLMGEAVSVNPYAADALYNRGCLLQRLNRLDEALASFDRAIEIRPDYVEALSNRANMLVRFGRANEALSDFERVTASKPDVAQVWNNQAAALIALNRMDEALSCYDRAVALKPDYASAWNDRGAALMTLNREQEALLSFDKALQIEPGNAQALVRRADLLLLLKRNEEAIQAYAKHLAIRPDNAEAWNGRGIASVNLKRHADALTAFDKALSLDRNNADAWNNRANVLFELKRFSEAARDYEKALALMPTLPYGRGYLAQCRFRSCDWHNLEEDREQLAAGVRARQRMIDPLGNLAISRSPQDQLDCARIYMADEPKVTPLWQGERYTHDRIRVAYLSADFRTHAVAFLVAGVFEHHDRSRFETIGISFGMGAESDMRKRIEKGVEHFYDVGTTSDGEVAALLKRLEVDIAVDLMGFTDGCRPGILAHRPAPIQVNFLGFPGTMGADHIHYIVADRVIIPEAQRKFYHEQVVYLPDTYQANDAKRPVAERTPTRAEAGLPETGFVFCCFNNNFKIMPDIFDIWMRLLRNVEGSVLWLLEDHATVAGNLRREAEARGVAPARLIFAPRAAPDEHLARQRLADLFIDTSPYTAHTTGSDALRVGLPIVTHLGPTFAARVASSLLQAVGMPELVTRSFEEYEALALRLARDPAALAAVKAKLARNSRTYPLLDTARFTRNLESAFTGMQERHRQGLPPESFAVAPARQP
jgi:predicted O-linked N-acetylglucosamine transferase (SPINDLY family)